MVFSISTVFSSTVNSPSPLTAQQSSKNIDFASGMIKIASFLIEIVSQILDRVKAW